MPTSYYRTNDDVIARLKDGWLRQVWQARSARWADYPDLDIDGECSEITPLEAQQAGAQLDAVPEHGEFAAGGGEGS